MTVAPTPVATGAVDELRPPAIATFGDDRRDFAIPRWMLLLALVVGQALLARFMSEQPSLGRLQVVILLGLIGYATIKRNAVALLCVAAYLPGAEIVWRQARVQVPYLIAPYMLGGIAILAALIGFKALTRPGRIAIVYLGLLMPSALATVSATGGNPRELLAFALVGPATLGLLVILCSQVTIRPWLYRRVLWIMVISGVGPLAVALSAINDYIVNVGELEFGTESNSIASGGFGPVQVSSLMGLTVLVAVLLFLVEKEWVPRALCAAIGMLSAAQSFLTFSRGGMFATAIALGGLALSEARNPRTRVRVLGVVVVTFAIGYFLIIPRVDAFTKGKLNERFSSTETGRTTLASNDLQLFAENPAFGVGPGMSRYRRLPYEICELRSDKCSNEGASHTEFTRMPAEHGVAGIAAIGLMILLTWQAIRRAGPSRSIAVTFLAWSIAQMAYANLRIAAIPFAFGLAFLRVRDADDEEAGDAEEEAGDGLPVAPLATAISR